MQRIRMVMMLDYYQILETAVDASQAEIREQYRFLLHAWHPDKFRSPADKLRAQERTRQINEAFEVLGSPEKREKYDRDHQNAGKKDPFRGTPKHFIDNFDWLIQFRPDKQYSIWLDPSFTPQEWPETNTPDAQGAWHADAYQLTVSNAGKTVIEAYPRAVSDVLLTVAMHFQPGAPAQAEAGLVFGISYNRYLPSHHYRFGINPSGRWKFSSNDRTKGEKAYLTGASEEAQELLSRSEPVRLIAAAFEDYVILAIQRQAVGEMIRLPQSVCGAVGVFGACPSGGTPCTAMFSNYRSYFIKQI
ncbi:MAG TPA: J domain-containing protein [Anaerolineaceae bacterium]|jgi:hypothetical protein